MKPPADHAVELAPLPNQVRTGVASAPGAASLVMMRVDTPQGFAVYFFTPEVADQVAALLKKSASEARSGLVVVGGGLVG